MHSLKAQFDNDDKYAKHQFRMSQQNSVILICIIFGLLYTWFCFANMMKGEQQKTPMSETTLSSIPLTVPQFEFETFHPAGTFKTMGDPERETKMLDHLKKMIHAYAPKMYNSLETAYFHMLQIRVSQEWDFAMGSVTEYPQQWMTYFMETQKLYKLGKVKTVCEIGMGNGHSSALWLTSTSSDESWKKGAQFHLFDICRDTPKKKQMYAKNYLTKIFGERFQLHCGESAKTLEKMKNLKCDIVHIDGDHSKKGVDADIDIMYKRVSEGALVFMDDLDYPEISSSVKEHADILEVLANVETTHVDFNLQSVRHRKPEDGKSKKTFMFGRYKSDALQT